VPLSPGQTAQAESRGWAGGSLCLSYSLKRTLCWQVLSFLINIINFLSQLSGDNSWIYDMSSNNIFCFYGASSWVNLDSRGESQRVLLGLFWGGPVTVEPRLDPGEYMQSF
jgi:hypothetical protein